VAAAAALPADGTLHAARLLEAQRLLRQGGGAAAEIVLRRLLEQAPELADGWNLLGVALGQQGDAAGGAACCRRALALRPDDPGFLLNLGNRLREQGETGAALGPLRAAYLQRPDDLRLVRALAKALHLAGQPAEAVAIAQRALDLPGDEAEAAVDCAKLLAGAHRLEEAARLYRRALDLRPDALEWWLELARIAIRIDALDQGIEACETVLRHRPAQPEARVMLAALLFRKLDYGRMREVLIGLEAGGADAANAANLTGMLMVTEGQVEEGVAAMRLVEQLAPDLAQLQMTRIMFRNYDPAASPVALFEDHRAFGMRFRGHLPPLAGPAGSEPDPERRLRIGYLSPDFRTHSVAYFLAPIFQSFDRDQHDAIAYAQVRQPDQVTGHFRELATAWRDVTRLDDQALAEQIRRDRIDILVELAGYTANSRLLALTARPAPIQISYLGYPNTTGLPQIDYRITDGIADPAGADALHTETLIRLPRCFLCYAFGTHAPAVGPPPFERRGHVTFGSLNSFSKVNAGVVALWARVLHAVPRSRLLLKALASGQQMARAHLLRQFARHGIKPERIELVPFAASPVDHLAVYNRIDIALDTHPYNGTTTTCEALWMGVPVITLPGRRHASRVGASLLSTIGFPAGIAADEQDYVATAQLLADNPELLRLARRNLRHDVARSALCDRHDHSRHLEAAYRAVWRLWCAEPDRRHAPSPPCRTPAAEELP
jgi:predicted O-linked N-acetylglucosamine transferase (SPINDLY family)